MLDMGFLPAIRRVLAMLPVKAADAAVLSNDVVEHRTTGSFHDERAEANRSKPARSGGNHGRADCLPC